MNSFRPRADAGPDRPISHADLHADMVVAYCEGMGLAAVAWVNDPAGSRLAVLSPDVAIRTPQTEPARWWCRRMDDAERLAAAATRALARHASNDRACRSPTASQCAAAIVAAAKRHNVVLYAEADILADAEAIVARVNAEFERFRGTGELKAINRSYRRLRLAALERGEKMPPYVQWLNKYRVNLVRDLAAALR
jgi:hypothetical protein